MIPVRLSLEGFLSYKSPVEIDLSRINIACVSGANGAGKSTLFDAMTWSLFGKARRSDDALIHNKADECQVVFEFEYENNLYRVDRIKTRGKGTTLEFQARTKDGEWKPFTEAGIRATEQRIQEVLGLDYETFVNASFFLQGKADMFSVQTAGKRKEILSNILGLTIWEEYRNEAATRRREQQKQLAVQKSILEEVANELDQEDDRLKKLAYEQELLKTREKLRESKESELERARLENAHIQSEWEKLDILRSQADEMVSQLANVKEKHQLRTNELAEFEAILKQETEIIDSHQAYQQVRVELSKLDEISSRYHALNLQKTELQGTIRSEKTRWEQERDTLAAKEKEIVQLKDHKQTLSEQALSLEQEAALLKAEIEKIGTLETDQKSNKDLQSEREGENIQLREKMDEVKERIKHLEESSGPDCPLCGQDLTDDHKTAIIVRLKSDGKTLGDRYRENLNVVKTCKETLVQINKEIMDLRAMRPRLTDLLAKSSAMRQQIEEIEIKISNWETEGSPRLSEIKTMLEGDGVATKPQAALAQIEDDIAALGYDPESHESTRKKGTALHGYEEKFRKLEQARTARAGLAREIGELEQAQKQTEKNVEQLKKSIHDLSLQIEKKQGAVVDLKKLESELREIRMQENHSRQEVGVAQQMVNVLNKQRSRKTELVERCREISRQIARLKMLEAAFGKDGVPALLIENAIPHIEIQANDILDKLSSGNMSVSFETEREYADKKREDRRQTLDIIIRDSAGSRPYELFSGGEAFRINFAIRLALSRVLAQRSGARLQTLIIDEGFGSQDAQGRQRLVEAINLVREDFAKILVITHLDELKDAFSSRIEVTKSAQGSQVEVII